MNSAALATSAYGAARDAVLTPRQIEYRAFARVTHRLAAAAAEPDGPGRFARLAEALHENTRLWGVLAADVALPGNQLPDELRAGIFALAEFSRRHGRMALDGEVSVDALIDVNRAVMKGLRGRSEGV